MLCEIGKHSITLAFSSKKENLVPARDLYGKILKRTVILFALGLFLSGFPLFDLQNIRSKLEYSINFEFFPPPAWLSDDVTFELHAAPEVDSDRLPVTARVTKNFAVRKPLRVAYLPIKYNGVEPASPTDVDYWLLRMYPVSGVDYYRLPVPDMVWDGDVAKSEILRQLLYNYTKRLKIPA